MNRNLIEDTSHLTEEASKVVWQCNKWLSRSAMRWEILRLTSKTIQVNTLVSEYKRLRSYLRVALVRLPGCLVVPVPSNTEEAEAASLSLG
jgi:hypothetical protein